MHITVSRRTLILLGLVIAATIVVGGLLLSGGRATTAAGEVAGKAAGKAAATQPNGGGLKPTHTAAFIDTTDPAQAASRFLRTFYTADYRDRAAWLARLKPLASADGYSLLQNLIAPALWPDLETAQTVVTSEQVTVDDRGLKAEGVSKMVDNTPWQIRAATVTLAPEAQWPGLPSHTHATNVLLSQIDGQWQFVMLLSDDQITAFQPKGAQ